MLVGFVIGMFVGGAVGVCLMCILQINREKER